MTGLKIVSASAVLMALTLAYFAIHPRSHPSVEPSASSVQTIPSAPAGDGAPADHGQFVSRVAGAEPATAAFPAGSPEGLTVENGTRIRGLARAVGASLTAQGTPVLRVGNFPVRPQMATVLLFSPASAEAAQTLARRLGDPPTRADPHATTTVGMTLVLGLDYARFPSLAGLTPPATPPTAPTTQAAVITTVPTTDAPMAQRGH